MNCLSSANLKEEIDVSPTSHGTPIRVVARSILVIVYDVRSYLWESRVSAVSITHLKDQRGFPRVVGEIAGTREGSFQKLSAFRHLSDLRLRGRGHRAFHCL